MRIYRLVLTLMCLISSVLTKRPIIELSMEALEQTVERANEFYSALKEDDDITPEDVVLNYVKTIPVIGDIVKIFTGDNDDDVKDILKKMQTQLKSLASLQEGTIQYLKDLKHNINLVVLKNQISTASKVINSCYEDLMHLMNNPTSPADQERVILCNGKIMQEVRHLGRILKEEEFTLESPKLFQYIIKKDGYCDGKNIVKAYKFLFGLLFLGCESAIVSETIKYGNTSETFFGECRTLIRDIESHMFEIYDTCKKDSCEDVLDALKIAVNLTIDKDLPEFVDEILAIFPWYSFSVFKLTGNPRTRIYGNHLPSYATVSSNQTYLIILWTPYETTTHGSDSSMSFMLQFEAANYKSQYRGMNITLTLSGSKAVVNGFFNSQVNKGQYRHCTANISLESSTSANSSNSNTQSNLFVLVMTFVLLIILLNCPDVLYYSV